MKTLIIILAVLVVAVSAQTKENKELAELQAILQTTRAGWTAGETSVNVLSVEEQQKMCGLLPGIYDLRNFPPEAIDDTPVARGNYETHHTSIKNQGSCGSCYSFGASATYEGWKIKKTGASYDLSEQYFMMKAKAIGPYGGCSGWYLDTSMNLLKNYGVCDESACTYKAYETACPSTVVPNHKIGAWASTTDKGTIQNALQNYGPVYVGFAVYSDFDSYTGGHYTYASGSLRGYHAVCIVGYDDIGWKVKNSWGTGWGENGYFRIAYSQMTNSVQFGTCFGGSYYITN